MNRQELHQHIGYLSDVINRYKAVLNALMQPALGLTDDEAQRLLYSPPPIEALLRDSELRDNPAMLHDVVMQRMKQWVNDVMEQRERDRNRSLIEAGCANCGQRYDGVYE